MDVDMRSPSFTMMRPTASSTSSKRPRSPASPSSAYDRPNKRLTLDPMASFPSGLPSPVPTPPPMATRQVSEDWVSRTRGLRIDRDHVGPVAVIQEEPRLVAGSSRQEGYNDDMNMDDEQMSEPWPPSSFAPSPNNNILSHPFPSRPQAQLDLQDIQRQCLPAITIPETSALPGQPYPPPYTSDPAPLTPTTPIRSSRMELQPEDIALPLSPPRKPRFTMGPRLDCEKCRLRVPGHYSHFN
ncbi:hypothetical protein BC629DRAFT_1589913 [Irpex lacteus]|nr:hypothetical protein BC629DRAFT_1589913 [Irpex lacteus]